MLLTKPKKHQPQEEQKVGVLVTKRQETLNIEKKVKIETYNYLLVWRNELEGLLDHSTAVHLQSQGQNVPTDPLCQGQLLFQAAKLGRRKPVRTSAKPSRGQAAQLPSLNRNTAGCEQAQARRLLHVCQTREKRQRCWSHQGDKCPFTAPGWGCCKITGINEPLRLGGERTDQIHEGEMGICSTSRYETQHFLPADALQWKSFLCS